MPLEELARILVEMYENEEYGKVVSIHLFGIRYADVIRAGEYSPMDIIRHSRLRNGEQMSEKYQTEINKGINLARYVVEKQTIVNFINNIGME
jgi:superfamily II helicase